MNDSKKELFISNYSKQLKSGTASLFIGSGISRQSGYSNWKDILRDCAKEIGLNVEKENLITLAEFYVNSKKQRNQITQTIIEFFKDDSGNPCKIHDIITTFPVRSIWTTNYDTLIERSLKRKDIIYSVLTDDKSYSNLNRNAKVIIHKLHGDVSNASECVITRRDYETFEQTHDIVLSELKGEMCTNSFLFLGYSFSDIDIQHILSKIRLTYDENNPQTHYCIMKAISKDECDNDEDFEYKKTRQNHYINDMESYGINIILVNSYDEIANILHDIAISVHMNDVFISGAFENNYTYGKRTASFARELAYRLVKEKYHIHTGYGENVGQEVVAGVFKACGDDSKVISFDSSVSLYPFPYKMNKNTNRKELYKTLRYNMISNTHISIFICGRKSENNSIINSKGCIDEYEISKHRKNLIIPIASTGGAAQYIWNKEKELDSIISNSKEFDMLSTEVDPIKLVDIVIKIIDKYKTKIF